MPASYHQLFDPSTEQLVTQVADRSVAAILHAWRDNREAQIVLTGGRTGLAIAQAIDVALFRATTHDVNNSKADDFRNSKVRVWFSDERFVPYDSADRSDTTLIAGFEKSLSYIHFERVATPDQCSLSEAATDYSTALATRIGRDLRFDVVILSMGEDGHIASLFPGHEGQLNSIELAIEVDNSPKPPVQRVSIGVARLAKASAIYIFAVGEGKRAPLEALLSDAELGTRSPISMLRKYSPATQIFIATNLKF